MHKQSKSFREAAKLVDPKKEYSVEEAIKLAKETSRVKFDSSVEVSFNLNLDPKASDQRVRTTTKLPHGTGKTLKVAAFVATANEKAAKDAGADIVGGDDLVKEIKKTEKTDFDIAVAEPAMMKGLAMIAKILGQRGLMPNPKAGTVGPNIAEMVKDLKSGGKVEIKTDDAGNLHQIIGKVSFDDKKLAENFQALKEAVYAAKPGSVKKEYVKSITISTSMGPGISVTK